MSRRRKPFRGVKLRRCKFNAEPGRTGEQYVVIFDYGDEAFSGLLEFAEKY
jgi:hypothetical protein